MACATASISIAPSRGSSLTSKFGVTAHELCSEAAAAADNNESGLLSPVLAEKIFGYSIKYVYKRIIALEIKTCQATLTDEIYPKKKGRLPSHH